MVKQTGLSIKLQAYSWIADALGTTNVPKQTLDEKIEPGSTVHDLFAVIAAKQPEFRENVFDPASGKFSDQVMVIVNRRLVQPGEFKQTELQDKDTVILSPVLVGG